LCAVVLTDFSGIWETTVMACYNQAFASREFCERQSVLALDSGIKQAPPAPYPPLRKVALLRSKHSLPFLRRLLRSMARDCVWFCHVPAMAHT
jgi:hypothetical protein